MADRPDSFAADLGKVLFGTIYYKYDGDHCQWLTSRDWAFKPRRPLETQLLDCSQTLGPLPLPASGKFIYFIRIFGEKVNYSLYYIVKVIKR